MKEAVDVEMSWDFGTSARPLALGSCGRGQQMGGGLWEAVPLLLQVDVLSRGMPTGARK